MIDWTKPIEAVRDDGLVCVAEFIKDDGGNMPMLVDVAGFGNLWFERNGEWAHWTIRNAVAVSSDSENDELAELRAFKEAALASGYVPAEPDKPETDEGAAERMAVDRGFQRDGEAYELALEAIEWGRSNPRKG